jgi:hypothetical protein
MSRNGMFDRMLEKAAAAVFFSVGENMKNLHGIKKGCL